MTFLQLYANQCRLFFVGYLIRKNQYVKFVFDSQRDDRTLLKNTNVSGSGGLLRAFFKHLLDHTDGDGLKCAEKCYTF